MNLTWSQVALVAIVLGAAALFWYMGAHEIAGIIVGLGVRELVGGIIGARRSAAPTAVALLVAGSLAVSAGCGMIRGVVKGVAPAERDRAIAVLVAYDFDHQEEQLGLDCDDAGAAIEAYRDERDPLLDGIETVYAGKCSSRTASVLDALQTAARIAASISSIGGILANVAHVIVGAIGDGISSDDCDAFARLHIEIDLNDEQADAALVDLCAE